MLLSDCSQTFPTKTMNQSSEPVTAPGAAAAAIALVEKEILIPEGLLGFPDDQRFKFTRFDPGDGGETPFFLLISMDSEISFALVHPDSLCAGYRVPVIPELLARLEAASEAELLPLLIVTVRDRVEDTTVNLQGPLMINPVSRRAVQLVVEDYPLRYPLLKSLAGEL